MREHEAASNTSRGNFTFGISRNRLDISAVADKHLSLFYGWESFEFFFFFFLFINRKKHNKSPAVISSGAFWGWIAVGGKQPTEKLL